MDKLKAHYIFIISFISLILMFLLFEDFNNNLRYFEMFFVILISHYLVKYFAFKLGTIDKQNKEFNLLLETVIPFLSIYVVIICFLNQFNLITNLEAVVVFLLGDLLIYMGNFMPKIKRNLIIGVRTKKTLSSDDAWLLVHRFGGKVSVITGIIMIITSLFNPFIGIVIFIMSFFITLIYVYKI